MAKWHEVMVRRARKSTCCAISCRARNWIMANDPSGSAAKILLMELFIVHVDHKNRARRFCA